MSIKSIWTIIILVLISAFPNRVLCQSFFAISQPRLELSDGNLIIDYDIRNAPPESAFDVWIEVTDESGTKINAKAVSGEIGEGISGGYNKRILWNYSKDKIQLDVEIFVVVKIEMQLSEASEMNDLSKENKSFSKANLILSSVLMPGLGQSKVNKGKPYWLLGIGGYGCIAGSILLNHQASSTYDEYKDSYDIIDSNSLYEKALNQDRYSKVLAYSAIGIWTANIIWVLVMPDSSRNLAISLYQGKVKIEPSFDIYSHAPMLSFHFGF